MKRPRMRTDDSATGFKAPPSRETSRILVTNPEDTDDQLKPRMRFGETRHVCAPIHAASRTALPEAEDAGLGPSSCDRCGPIVSFPREIFTGG